MRPPVALCIVVLAVALPACGGSGDSSEAAPTVDETITAIDGLTGTARTNELVQLAEEQGSELNLYTSSTTDYMEALTDAFTDAYDIDVSLYKTASEALVQRMVEEASAGFHGSDVTESNTPSMIALDENGILVPYDSPKADKLVAGSVGKSWIGDKANTFIVAWNTDRVPKGEEPRSFVELADPKWKGRLVLEADDSDWYMAMWEHLVDSGRTPAEVDRIFEAIARNATFVNGHTLMAELTAAGEFDVTVNSYLHTVEELKDDGAPLAWEPAIEPIVSRADSVAVVKDAEHPAAALLFVDFLLDEGQQVFADAYLTPARKDLSVPPSIQQIVVDVPKYVAEAADWQARYEQLVRMGKEGPENP